MSYFFYVLIPFFMLNSDLHADGIRLLEGDLNSKWEHVSTSKRVSWTINEDRVLTILPGSGDIQSKDFFRDFKLSFEFMLPENKQAIGQQKSNGGVYLQGLYELQLLESIDNPTYFAGSCLSFYKMYEPIATAMCESAVWHRVDVQFKAAQLEHTLRGQLKIKIPARCTVWYDGTLVHQNVELKKATGSAGRNPIIESGPIRLQDHGAAIQFRNIMIEELSL